MCLIISAAAHYLFVSPLQFSCRGSRLQDGALCADDSHSDRHPHHDLHRHWAIPGHCLPAENEEAILVQKSIQDARYSTSGGVSCYAFKNGCVCLVFPHVPHTFTMAAKWSCCFWEIQLKLNSTMGFSPGCTGLWGVCLPAWMDFKLNVYMFLLCILSNKAGITNRLA